jgi:3-methyladenine DNA glycosylase Mpg
VYLCYGLHKMLNVVADKEGVGAAVLIRSCAPISGNLFQSYTSCSLLSLARFKLVLL